MTTTALDEEAIFNAARQLGTQEERRRFLNEHCAADAGLRSRVEALLRVYEQEPDFLQTPAPLCIFPSPISEGPGTIIGSYKLIEQIGEGGFSLVFMAEQQKPIRRKVALKIIKPGMDSREVITRFEAERQALAMMDHPHIARVFDAGTTETGRPFFVMELVRGIPITEFCDKRRLNLRQRLELFVNVCHAIEHAHQQGIIHRDIKPTNVLVTLHDGTPVVKVIDFGIAKAIGQRLTEQTLHTRFMEMIGTPLYMSPEQAEMSGLEIDTRSDIYSLGVLLYELLTSATPFDRERVKTAGFDELRRMIREEEPPKPSTRLTTQGRAIETVSQERNINPRKLTALLRGDLDWIAMKALEKDRQRRYASAAAFAEDVQRHLAHKPVKARPKSRFYRIRRFARRYKAALVAALLIMVTLAVGGAVTAWYAWYSGSQIAARGFSQKLLTVNKLVQSAQQHEKKEEWALAHADYTKATEVLPDIHIAWFQRGYFYVRMGLWQRAAADFAKALDTGSPVDNITNKGGWEGVPLLLSLYGDRDHYRLLTTKMFEHADRTTPTGNEAFALSALLRSSLVGQIDTPTKAELVKRAESLLQRNKGVPQMLYAAGLAHYYAGETDQATQRLKASVRASVRGNTWEAGILNRPVLAMNLHHARKIEEARDEMASAQQDLNLVLNQIEQGPVGTMNRPGGLPGWWDWIEYLELCKEASLLVNGSAPEELRLHAIEQAALAAIE